MRTALQLTARRWSILHGTRTEAPVLHSLTSPTGHLFSGPKAASPLGTLFCIRSPQVHERGVRFGRLSASSHQPNAFLLDLWEEEGNQVDGR